MKYSSKIILFISFLSVCALGAGCTSSSLQVSTGSTAVQGHGNRVEVRRINATPIQVAPKADREFSWEPEGVVDLLGIPGAVDSRFKYDFYVWFCRVVTELRDSENLISWLPVVIEELKEFAGYREKRGISVLSYNSVVMHVERVQVRFIESKLTHRALLAELRGKVREGEKAYANSFSRLF